MPLESAPGEPRRYLCCVAERDLSALLALIPNLALEQNGF
jgi:hypothetical protein